MPRRRALLAFFLLVVVALGCKREEPAPRPSGASAPASAHREPGATGPEVKDIRHIEQLTGGAKADEPLPMIVAIHGRGGRPEEFLPTFFQRLPFRARLILPYGTEPLGDGFEWFPMSDNLPLDAFAADVEKAAHRVAKMITALVKSRPTLGKPIVTGFSQGGFLSFAIAILHPELIAEAHPVAGRLPPELWPSSWPAGKPMPKIYALHGDADTIVTIADDQKLVARLKQLGVPIELHAYPGVQHTISPEMRRDLEAGLAKAAEAARSR